MRRWSSEDEDDAHISPSHVTHCLCLFVVTVDIVELPVASFMARMDAGDELGESAAVDGRIMDFGPVFDDTDDSSRATDTTKRPSRKVDSCRSSLSSSPLLLPYQAFPFYF